MGQNIQICLGRRGAGRIAYSLQFTVEARRFCYNGLHPLGRRRIRPENRERQRGRSQKGTNLMTGNELSVSSPPNSTAADPVGGLSLEKSFHELAQQWRDETGMSSSVSEKLRHPAYRKIIEMGEPVLPHVLRELRDRPGFWFEALRAITKQTPVSPEERGFQEGSRGVAQVGQGKGADGVDVPRPLVPVQTVQIREPPGGGPSRHKRRGRGL